MLSEEMQKKMVNDWGIPRGLMVSGCDFKEHPEFKGKLVRTIDLNARTIILSGVDSIHKDQFAACLLINHVSQNLGTVRFYVASKLSQTPEQCASLSAFMGLDLIGGYHIADVHQIIRHHIMNNKRVILGCRSLESLTLKYGEDFVSYISSDAINVDLTVKTAPIPEI